MNQTRRRLLHAGLAIGAAGMSAAVISRPTIAAAATPPADQSASSTCSPLLDHSLRPLMGSDSIRLCDAYADQVLLIVNTASKCGFVGQFEGLEALYRRYAGQGLTVLGFPSEDFRQEFDAEADVAEFCKLNYGVTFPMFQKVHVRGKDVHPLYAELATEAGDAPSWNFYKYLVDRNGKVQQLYGSGDEPLGAAITGAIESLL